MAEKIQLLNPNPSKKGATIDLDKYERVKETILNIVRERESITFKELMNEVVHQLRDTFDGSPSWHCTAVKLDLEARGIIERAGTTSPQRLRLTQQASN
ncbi:DUF6958 family protein [Bacillus thermotolerans]|uniref:Uncharacterized protein n=1 Tax=Bacillus thermotolerans TaxID=1221996 RepID=A0A0F5I4X9_BACTR|nr:hypothetical protein [Bacillus thermotolerans]KKB38057.1 hypothetical protein QY97_03432 [Bacillus thermotolerans]KKB40719.1 hypothetical protein QY95_01293 [Bacillus thermotolerans]